MQTERFDTETRAAILRASAIEKLPVGVIATAVRADTRTVVRFLDRVCKKETACPDDIIRPCVLDAGHAGFHFGGRP